jgi:hypothetical protein
VDQSASTTLNFRMADLKFTAPSAFTTGIVAQVFQGNTQPNDPACNLQGTATLSWLLRFDTTAGTLTTGGAKPAMSSSGPYTFDDEMVTQGGAFFHIVPVTLSAPVSGCGFNSTAGDVILPIFLDAAGTQAVLLPLHALRFSNGQMSADHGCIGRYNSAGLDPASACLPDSLHPSFLPGASLDAFVTLEEADTVIISALQETLCVLLSGNAQTYGDGGQPVNRCKRDPSGKIVYQGDWCSVTNQAATPTCADAARLAATFAAQAVQIQ